MIGEPDGDREGACHQLGDRPVPLTVCAEVPLEQAARCSRRTAATAACPARTLTDRRELGRSRAALSPHSAATGSPGRALHHEEDQECGPDEDRDHLEQSPRDIAPHRASVLVGQKAAGTRRVPAAPVAPRAPVSGRAAVPCCPTTAYFFTVTSVRIGSPDWSYFTFIDLRRVARSSGCSTRAGWTGMVVDELLLGLLVLRSRGLHGLRRVGLLGQRVELRVGEAALVAGHAGAVQVARGSCR